MPSRWCCRLAERGRAAAVAASAAAALAAGPFAAGPLTRPAAAATVLDQRVTLEIAGERVREHTVLSVRLDGPADVEAWSSYPVYVDEHRTLVDAAGAVTHPGGERQRVKRRHRDEVAASGDGIFHDSSRFHLLQLPGLRPGSVVEIETTVDVAPYYPAGALRLVGGDRIERLRVEVRGAGAGWRWRIDGPAAGLTAEETAGGVVVTGAGIEPPDPPEASPGGAAIRPVLRYGWGGDGTWAGVGRWYAGLLETLPRAEPAVRERARALAVEDRRETLEALTAMVQREVRYVAVEVGIGGYRPSPPAETFERRWGDCKDKALLLIDLLAEVGIPAHPALVMLADGDRVDAEFPAPGQFNHLIVAVPAAAVAASPTDAVAGGYLFVDPTQSAGGARWLGPGVQGHHALVVVPGGGELVRLPVIAGGEGTDLVVNLHVDSDGGARGGAGLHVRGLLAQALIDHNSRGESQSEGALRSIFSGLVPGADLADVGWNAGDGPVPTVDLAAAVTVPRLLQGEGDRASLMLPATRSGPDPRLVGDRTEPLVTDAGVYTVTWHVALPEGCTAPEDDAVEFANAAGSFRQTVTRRGEAGFTLERAVEIHHRWYGPELLPALGELSLAENRALRRRLRFACPPGRTDPAAAP